MSDEIAIFVDTLDALRTAGQKVVRGSEHNIVVFADAGTIHALDNRCPHMGFPLDRGSVKDGILTCHWHEARFDLESGCTFDLWADDVLRFEVWIENENRVMVSSTPSNQRDLDYYQTRLIQGIEQNVPLVQAKSLLALLQRDEDVFGFLLSSLVDYTSHNLNTMTEGLHRLGCVANLYPHLDPLTAYQALLYASRQIAAEVANSVPHRYKQALSGKKYDLVTLQEWLLQWVKTRHTDATERTLLTGVKVLDNTALADLTFSAANERLYAGGGHLLEACNKVFQIVDHLEKHNLLEDTTGQNPTSRSRLFSLLVRDLTGARGREESTTWHHPVEIVEPLQKLDEDLVEILSKNRGDVPVPANLIDILVSDNPIDIVESLKQALVDHVSPLDLAREVCFAAALRLARFATSNEVTDWFNPQHSYIHANASYLAVARCQSSTVVRSVFQSAISVYTDRFLNVPPARLPAERVIAVQNTSADGLLGLLASQLDSRGEIDEAANLVYLYLKSDHPRSRLIDALTLATVREDIDFHSLQLLDAAAIQAMAWEQSSVPEIMIRERIETIMVGVARNLAAHCPTRRAGQQTALIAARLQRGESIFETEDN